MGEWLPAPAMPISTVAAWSATSFCRKEFDFQEGITAGEAADLAVSASPSPERPPNAAAMTGDWVGFNEVTEPVTWRVHGGSVYKLSPGKGGEEIQGYLSDSAVWLDLHDHRPTSTRVLR